MTDLINNKVDKLIKEDVETLQAIINKFAPILQLTKHQKDIPYLAYIINACVEHIHNNHADQHKDRKSWAIVIIKDMYLAGKLKKEIDISKIIDEFIKHIEDEFQTYANNHIAISQYDLEVGFVYQFIKKKIGK